ncbi:N-acetyltransferase [Panacibacter ginsenosidivorans]|uniref:N-acetyltransferase n=1 Tax=Panacibacter ginsenosidivorans TaxID=1813871 RepID=A0A5B8V493_9BACT|nr:GNAT family N-acetyltransferase [Panacibacter ginsenosidivorans]QEC66204.1 N-acetyltransferase [Panacibacter ginsenosidivorans]
MQIEQQQKGVKGMFYVGDSENPQAAMVYRRDAKDNIIIEHTEVGDELRGKNAGFQLVRTAVEYARVHNIKILPLCPFAKSVFAKKPEFADVLIR